MVSESATGAMAEFQMSEIERGSHKGLNRSPFLIRGGLSHHNTLACLVADLVSLLDGGPFLVAI